MKKQMATFIVLLTLPLALLSACSSGRSEDSDKNLWDGVSIRDDFFSRVQGVYESADGSSLVEIKSDRTMAVHQYESANGSSCLLMTTSRVNDVRRVPPHAKHVQYGNWGLSSNMELAPIMLLSEVQESGSLPGVAKHGADSTADAFGTLNCLNKKDLLPQSGTSVEEIYAYQKDLIAFARKEGLRTSWIYTKSGLTRVPLEAATLVALLPEAIRLGYAAQESLSLTFNPASMQVSLSGEMCMDLSGHLKQASWDVQGERIEMELDRVSLTEDNRASDACREVQGGESLLGALSARNSLDRKVRLTFTLDAPQRTWVSGGLRIKALPAQP